jgi:glycosyltransferase involved in cell wall biosynthesis
MNLASKIHTAATYLLVTAAYNEEKYIERTIKSVVAQTVPPLKWVIVSDGSTDRTDEIVLKYAQKHRFIMLNRITEQHPRNYSAQVLAINAGLGVLRAYDSEFVANLDADVSFEPTYYQRLISRFESDPKLGLAGGYVLEKRRGVFQSRPGNSTRSVPHAVQFFRRSCFDSVGLYQPLAYGGPDWVAEVRARQLGWKVAAFQDLPVCHYRATASSGGQLRGRLRQGRMDYSVGSLFLFEVLKCARRLRDSPSVLGAIARLYGFLSLYLSRKPRCMPDEFVQYLQQEQRKRLLALIR